MPTQYTCLWCEESFIKKRHACNAKCDATTPKRGVAHVDFCDDCTKVIINYFEAQFRKPLRIRFEKSTDGGKE